MKKLSFVTLFFLAAVVTAAIAGTTGKIDGTVVDAQTGEKLIGVNVLVEGTNLGAATNVDGYFVIINVPPGTYTVKASLVGYNGTSLVDVRVVIDQTTTLKFSIRQTTVEAQEVVVVAQRPAVQKDVSSSQTNLNFREFENLPAVQTISNVMGLQAGIQISQITGDLVIRGGGGDQTAFMLDGYTLRDERTNRAYLGISLTSIQDVQIQTGGFNAEYGNVRSGIVNVITREGSQQHYTVSMIARYSPPAQKHFGDSPNSFNSFWIRPYVDPAVCWTGTSDKTATGYKSPWDPNTQAQYPDFEGWNSIAAKTLTDGDPANDLTPEAAQRVFLWQHRRKLDIDKSDYDIDASIGGPVPNGGELGNLRFFASYRSTRNMYLVPLSKNYYTDYNAQLKLTSDVSSGMKLIVEGLLGKASGTNDNNAGSAGVFTTPQSIANVLNRVSYIDARIFATDYWGPTTINTYSVGTKFTHVLDPATFYEVTANQVGRSYSTNPGRLRDIRKVYRFANGYYIDESPYGFQMQPSTGIDGLRMGVGFSNSRDTSKVTVFTARVDLTSQFDRYNQFKTGIEYVYTDNNVNSASVDVFLPSGRSASVWHTYPIRGAVYVQDKLEFEGMIANLGVRLDYSNPRGDWYEYNPFDPNLVGDKSLLIDKKFTKQAVEKKTTLSPRLGVSFPITVNSKMYFNYGHFRSMPTPDNLFLVRRFSDNNNVTFIANPNNPLPKTVAYELGYEHSLFEEYLVHLAGYYKDVTNQLTTTRYLDPKINLEYSLSTANAYQDIRGFEVSLTKNRGTWVAGFVNYTYMVSSGGRFGFRQVYSKESLNKSYQTDPTNIQNDLYQSKPIPQPYARANVDFFTPADYGPTYQGIGVLSDWRLSLLGNWSSGSHFTWAGGGSSSIPGIENNVQWRDYYNLDLRLSKTIYIGSLNLQLFMDMTNVLNIRYFDPNGYGFKDGNDFDAYMKSLHLPSGIAERLQYGNIPGDDKPGDYRTQGVAPVHMEWIANTGSVTKPISTYIYYDASTKQYLKYMNNAWVPESQSRVDQVLKDKAYIDMPNLNYFTFLNPRDVFFGFKITVDI